MQDFVYHMTLKSHFIRKLCTKMSQFRHYKMRHFYEKAVVSFRFFQLSAIALKKFCQSFDSNAGIYIYFLRF